MKAIFRQIILRILVVLVIIILPSCIVPGGDDNEPVRVNFDVRFDVTNQTPAYFTFSRAILGINSIRFNGVRQAGNDVAFTTRPDRPVGTFVLTPTQFLRPMYYFDIQEGVYNSMRWEVMLMPIDDDALGADDDDFPAENYGFLLEGRYTRQDGLRAEVVFALAENEVLTLQTVALAAARQITLIVGQTYNVELVINPYSLMGGIPRSMLDNAEIDVIDRLNYILITPEDNRELYDLMILRLSRDLRAVIN